MVSGEALMSMVTFEVYVFRSIPKTGQTTDRWWWLLDLRVPGELHDTRVVLLRTVPWSTRAK